MTIITAENVNPERVERPPTNKGVVHWLRNNLFRSPLDTLLTVIVGIVVVDLSVRFFGWVTTEAQWAVVTQNFRVLMQGLYPVDQSWRVIVAVVWIAMLAGISWGIWGRMALRTAVALIVGVLLFIFVPLLPEAIASAGSFGAYLQTQLIPLLQVLQLPVIVLTAFLIVGYVIGEVAERAMGHQFSRRFGQIGWLISIPLVFILVRGFNDNTPILPYVSTSSASEGWGGLLLTFMLAFVAITACFPLGIVLALGRASSGPIRRKIDLPRFWYINPRQWFVPVLTWWRGFGQYPIIKLFCIMYIEFFRGVPLVTVFFTAHYIVPYALGGVEVEPVVRAMIALTLFEAAYIAEIVRGGLQALPPGQLEAGKAIGLNPVYITLFITLPQALRIVIPALVGQFITMFKDTSLVAIIGLSDLLGIATGVLAQSRFVGRNREIYVFVAIVYFVFCYGMSRAAQQLERSGSGKVR